MYFIGIDLGTSSVKVLLVDENGNIKNTSKRDYELYFPNPGWSEQNPDDWWDAVKECIKDVSKGIDKNETKGIATAGQMHGLVILDENDKVIRRAILWNDGRSSKETEYLNDKIGKDKLSSYTGNIAFAGFTAPKILWVKENENDNFKRIKKIMLPKDYINYKLSGVFATDYSDASGMLLLDVKNKTWSKEMIDICGININMLPKLYESYEVIGHISSDIANELELNNDIIVVAGAGDNAAAAIGTGTVGNGAANISVGTSGTVFIVSDKFIVDPKNALHSFVHSDGKFHLLGCMLSAAACYKWWLENILDINNYDDALSKISIDSLGENNVYYLPYLMGERAPHNDPFARSCFIGMTMDTTKYDLIQSVYEGVAFGILDMVSAARNMGLTVDKSMICGGGSKNKFALDIYANILDLELDIPVTEQGPGYGAAILAMVGSGVYSDVKVATDKLIKIKNKVLPNTELVKKYKIKYEKFKTLYPTLKDTFRNL